MHGLDIFLLIVFLAAMVYGFKKGFISVMLTWMGLLISLILIARLGPMIQLGLMAKYDISPFFSTVLTIVLIFFLISILVAILKILLNDLAKLLNLSFLNRIIGSVFGFLNIIVILTLFLAFLNFLPRLERFKSFVHSSVIITEVNRVYELVKVEIKENIRLD